MSTTNIFGFLGTMLVGSVIGVIVGIQIGNARCKAPPARWFGRTQSYEEARDQCRGWMENLRRGRSPGAPRSNCLLYVSNLPKYEQAKIAQEFPQIMDEVENFNYYSRLDD